VHWTFSYPWDPLWTWLAVAAVAAVLALAHLPLRQRGRRGFWAWGVLLALRLAALGVLVFVLLEPTVSYRRTDETRAFVALLVDRSASMAERDAKDGPTRFAQALATLKKENLAGAIAEKAKLRVFDFATGLTERKPDELPKLAAPAGTATSLGLALGQLRAEFKGKALAAAVVLSDGRDNAGSDPVAAARDLKAPVFAVGYGRARPKTVEKKERDLAVLDVEHDRRVIAGHPTEIAATVRSQGFPPRSVPVELRLGADVVATSAGVLSPDRPKRRVTLLLTPPRPGQYVYTIRVPPDPAEPNKANNEKEMLIYVADPVARILYVEGRPRWEFKFLSRALLKYKSVEHTSIVRITPKRPTIQGSNPADAAAIATMTPNQLRRLKAVVIGDIPRTAFGDAQIATMAALVEQGASLLFLGGRDSLGPNGFAGTKIGDVLPMTLVPNAPYFEKNIRVRLTPDGRAHPAFQDATHDWSQAPPLISLSAAGKVKPGATVVMRTLTQQGLPVVVAHQYGRGKVALVLTDSTWRWKLGEADGKGPPGAHDEFWRRVILWLMPEEKKQEEKRAVQLVADRLQYDLNDRVILIATVLGAEGTLVKDAAVEIRVVAPDGKDIRRRAAFGRPDPRTKQPTPGYGTEFRTHAAGKYRVIATAEAGGTKLGRDEIAFLVGDTSLERTETDPNPALLRKVAEASRGRYYEPPQAGRILKDLVAETRKSSWTEKKAVWNTRGTLALFLLFACLEWAFRRARQMK
jgi:uncharacterized membrane protein